MVVPLPLWQQTVVQYLQDIKGYPTSTTAHKQEDVAQENKPFQYAYKPLRVQYFLSRESGLIKQQ